MMPVVLQMLIFIAAKRVFADPGSRALRGSAGVWDNSTNANASLENVSLVPFPQWTRGNSNNNQTMLASAMEETSASVGNVSLVPFPHLTGDIIIGASDKRPKLAAMARKGDIGIVDDDDVFNNLRLVVVNALWSIPHVGGVVSALVSIFWPQQKKNVWDQIKDKVQAMVNATILNYELQQRQADLDAFKTTLRRYAAAGDRERKGFLSALITQADNIYSKLTSSLVKEQILPITVAFSLLHLGVLLERYNHGKLIIGEDNSEQWLKELQELYLKYGSFFEEQYDAWYKFRLDQIAIDADKITRPSPIPPLFYKVATGKAHDKLTGAEIYYEETLDRDNWFRPAVESVRDMWMNRAVADMAAAMSPFFISHRVLPGREKEGPQVFPALQVIWMGPYSVTTLGISQSEKFTRPNIFDKPGQVTSWVVREWNSVDYQKLKFSRHDGQGVGNPRGGKQHEVRPPQGAHFIGSTMLWARGLLVSIQLHFSDGTSTPVLGNRGRWRGTQINDIVGGGLYQLDAGAYAQGRGPSATRGTGLLKHRFSIPGASWKDNFV